MVICVERYTTQVQVLPVINVFMMVEHGDAIGVNARRRRLVGEVLVPAERALYAVHAAQDTELGIPSWLKRLIRATLAYGPVNGATVPDSSTVPGV